MSESPPKFISSVGYTGAGNNNHPRKYISRFTFKVKWLSCHICKINLFCSLKSHLILLSVNIILCKLLVYNKEFLFGLCKFRIFF